MKIIIIGGGNMGGAIALGLATGNFFRPEDITVINRRQEKAEEWRSKYASINAIAGDYTPVASADIVLLAIKPWLVKDFLSEHKELFKNPKQLLLSVAAGISLFDMEDWTFPGKIIFGIMPNTAIAVKQSMTFITSLNESDEQRQLIINIFSELGKVQHIEEKQMSAAMSLASCGIAYAFRYIRAASEGGVEMGISPVKSRDIVMQTLRGAIELLEANGTHPEEEIDKVTTPGGITIKGLNEMEHAGFTSAVIKGLKASNVK